MSSFFRATLLLFAVTSHASLPDEAETRIESPRLRAVAQALDAGDGQAVDALWKAIQGKAPLIEAIPENDQESWVTYVWRGTASTRKIDMLGGVPTSNRSKWDWERLRGSDLWFKTQRTPNGARFGYALRENGTGFKTDPLNSRTCAGRSILEMPNAPPERWIRARADVPKGTLESLKIKSAILNEERAFSLFRPATNAPGAKHPGLLVVFDGESYGARADSPVPTPTILDNLLAEKEIPAMVAVFLESQNTRERDLLCSKAFNRFLVEELVPWVRRRVGIATDPSMTVVAGSSYGGLAAGCAVLYHPRVFGKALLQSPTLTYAPGWTQNATDYAVETGWLTQQFVSTPRRPVSFYLQVGRYEGGPIYNLVREARQLRDVLQARGYTVTYRELLGAHDYVTWRDSFGDGLAALKISPERPHARQ